MCKPLEMKQFARFTISVGFEANKFLKGEMLWHMLLLMELYNCSEVLN